MALGDTLAVRELSDVISLSAQLDAGTIPSEATREAVWLAATVAIATGPDLAHEDAKSTLRAAGSAQPLWRVAVATADRHGLSDALARASEAVGFSASDLG